MDPGLPPSNNDLLQQEADKKGSMPPPLIYYIPLGFGMIEGLVCKAGFLSTRSQIVLLSILTHPRKQSLLDLALVFFCLLSIYLHCLRNLTDTNERRGIIEQ